MKIHKDKKHTQSAKASLASLVLEKAIFCIMVLLFLFAFSSQVFANEQAEKVNSATSVGGIKGNNADTADKIKLLKQKVNDLNTSSSLATNKETLTYLTRDQKIANKQLAAKQKGILHKSGGLQVRSVLHDFAIFSASSKLLEDDDVDGYYNTFGIQFDADILFTDPEHRADVYAEIYLSENGGPWVHLYTTDLFELQGDSADDEYEVITHLTQNYRPNQYNVLIDLYQAGSSHIAASYSSDDSDQLYALPLESQEFEHDYDEDYYDDHHHGGSVNVYGLLLLCCLVGQRFFKTSQLTSG